MIKNDRQLKLFEDRLIEFKRLFEKINQHSPKSSDEEKRKIIQLNSIKNEIDSIDKEITVYTNIKSGNVTSFCIDSITSIHEGLIKSRIAKGLTQGELAKRIGIKEQQIQRYETTNYETASLPRINEVVSALGIKVSVHITNISTPFFMKPEKYGPKVIEMAQSKLKDKKTLLV